MKLKIGDKVRLSEAARKWQQWLNEDELVGYVRGIDERDRSLPYLIGKENSGGEHSLNTRWFQEEDVLGTVDTDYDHGTFYVMEVYSSGGGKSAPSKVFFSHKQARYVARKLTREHGGTFLVLRAEVKYSSKTEVVKEVL